MTELSDKAKRQREDRARAFKLKKWIANIESQSSKTFDMEQKLTEYYRELEQLQDKRGGSRDNASSQVINGLRNAIKQDKPNC